MKKNIIERIENLYPADNSDKDNANIGKVLLEKAKIEIGCIDWFENWRNYPEDVLIKYLENCIIFKEVIRRKIQSFVLKYPIKTN